MPPPWLLPLLTAFGCAGLSALVIGRRRRGSSFVADLLRYLVLSILLAAISLYLWGLLGPELYLPAPPRDFTEIPLKEIPAYRPLWLFQSGWILLLAGADIRRKRTSKPYDLFISFHPNDVLVAKYLADRLILSGRKVWFTPYERDQLGRSGRSWPALLLKVIRNTDWALALVDDDYTGTLQRQSRDFRELSGTDIFHYKLIETLGPDRLIEVRIPGRDRRTEAKAGHGQEGLARSSQRILDQISEKTGWTLPRAEPGSDILRNRFRDRPSAFDVFISYKSEDVDIVRPVVDRLIASGLAVWFAEYQILLQGREKFQQAIDDGIDRCSFGLAFTNNRYVKDSPYCRLEIERLLERLGPGKILEVKIPEEELPHRLYPALGRSPGVVGRTRHDILKFISEAAGIGVFPEDPPAAGRPGEGVHTATCLGRPFRLATAGWQLTKRGMPDASCSAQGLEFKFQGRYPLFVNLYAGPETSLPGQRQSQKIDDRRMYDYLLEYAPKHLGRLETRPKGVHLLFHEDLSQMALTYWMEHYWTRKYSLIIPNPVNRKMAEFLLTFGFVGSFEEYCLHTALMDDFARSLEWR